MYVFQSDSDEMIITSSNSGDLMKVSADRSTVSWYQKYRSPVVSVYSMGYDGSLNEVSQQIIVPQMMEKLLGNADMPARNAELLLAEVVKSDMRASPAGSASKNSLERMLYVGQYGSILFALPTLFDPKIPKNALPAPVPELLLPVEPREKIENFSAAGDHSSVVVPEQHDEEFVENKTETTAVIVSPVRDFFIVKIQRRSILINSLRFFLGMLHHRNYRKINVRKINKLETLIREGKLKLSQLSNIRKNQKLEKIQI